MNLGVAHCAGLILRRLVMSGTLRALHRKGVTLQAQQVHLADTQVAWIVRSVRRMTTDAPLGFHGHMLVYKRSLFFGVAFHANCISGRDRPHLTHSGCAMDVVAVGAEQKAFVNTVVIGPGEIRLCRHVAAIAQIWLRLRQQMIGLFGVVRGVAVQAANIVAGMRRGREVPLLHLLAMTTQATRGRLSRRQGRETDDLRDITATIHVLRTRPVTGFAAVPALKRCLEVGRQFEVFLVDLFMAGLTNVRANVFRRVLLRCGAFFLWIPSKSRLDSEQKETCRDDCGEDLSSNFNKRHTGNCQSLEGRIESENWQNWQYLSRQCFVSCEDLSTYLGQPVCDMPLINC